MRIRYLISFCMLFLVGCNSIQLPEEQPKDFAFVMKYGVEARNELNTYQGTFTKDLISDGVAKTELKLTTEELKEIYQRFREINVLSYPNNYRPDQSLFVHRAVTPHQTYYFKIRYDGKEKEIFWADGSQSEKKKAERLRDLIDHIRWLIESKSEYRKLPEANGGYL